MSILPRMSGGVRLSGFSFRDTPGSDLYVQLKGVFHKWPLMLAGLLCSPGIPEGPEQSVEVLGLRGPLGDALGGEEALQSGQLGV